MNTHVKNLIGRNRQEAEGELVRLGYSAVAMLLEELVQALDRVVNAPSGYGRGPISAHIGMFKLVNTRDQALAKRIPRVIWLIASANKKRDWEVVHQAVLNSTDSRVLASFEKHEVQGVRALAAR